MSAEAEAKCRLTHWGGFCPAGIPDRAGRVQTAHLCSWALAARCGPAAPGGPDLIEAQDVPLWGVTVPICGCCGPC